MPSTLYDLDLDRNPANFQPLTPLSFLERAAAVHPDRAAIVHGARSWTYAQFYARSRRLASALAGRGIGRGDTVAVMLANTPAMLEAHYGIPMTGAVLNALNTRLDAAVIAFTLDHAEAKVLITDREFSPVIKAALALAKAKPLVIDYDDPEFGGAGERLGTLEYEDFLADGDPDFAWRCRTTNGTPSPSTTHPAPPATPRASSITTAVLICSPWQCAHLRHGPASGLSVDAADVPLQRLVLPVDRPDRCRRQCLPAPGPGRRDVRCDRGPQGDASVRRADRDVDAAQCAGVREEAAAAQGGVRHRRGAAAGSRARRHAGRRV